MSIDTIYVMAGGDYFQSAFNGVVTLLGSNSWASMFRIVGLVAAMTLFATYIKGHDPLEVIKFMAFFILITSVLLIPKRTVQIIDLTNSTGVYRVDNVPVGLSAPMKFITGIGASVTKAYESIFHTPDSITYSKTGMLFGANLVGNASDIFSRNADLSALMGDYVRQCVIGDIMLNNKYTLQELMGSADPYTLIFKKPSPLRGVIVPYGNKEATAGFQTCEALAKNVLMPKLGLDTKDGGKTWDYYVRSFFGGKPNANVLFANMLGDSYNFFYKGGKSASDIMRNNVVMSSLRQGFSGYAANSGDAASLINLASNSSYSKMRLSWGASSTIATTFLPVMHTVLMAMLVGLFPIIILLAMIHTLTMPMLKNFVFTLLYLQMWPPLFAILNYVMSFYLQGQTKAMDFSLSNVAYIQQMHSDIGLMAGWLTLSIPFIAAGVVSGLWRVVSQAGNYLGTATNSSTSSSASQAADGTWAFNNMQMDNVAGHKWDTNQSFRTGQQTTQHASGATSTLTQSGETVWDSRSATSSLATQINGTQAVTSSLQAQARESEVKAQSSLNGYNSSVNSAWNQLSQYATQRGNSDTLQRSSDNSQSATQSEGASKMWSAVESYAKANGISNSAAFNEMQDKTSRGTVTAGTKGSAGGSLGFAKGEIYADGNVAGSTGSSHGTAESSTQSNDSRHDKNAQYLKDFKQGQDMVTSVRTSEGTNHADNHSNSHLEQLGASLSVAKNQYQQYSDSLTRSHEYSEMASRAQTQSSQINSTFDQQFANYVSEKSPANASDILTNTSSPEIARQREQLAREFVDERLRPMLEADYQANKGGLGQGMQGVSAPQGVGHVEQDFSGDQQYIHERAGGANIKTDTAQKVAEEESENRTNVMQHKENLNQSQSNVQNTMSSLKTHHNAASQDHEVRMQEEREDQTTSLNSEKFIPDVNNKNSRFNNGRGN